MHAVHRGVVHAGYRDPEGDRTGDQADAFLPRQKGAQSAIGRNDRDHHRQHDHRGVMFDGKMPRQPVDADVMHAGDAQAEQHRGGDNSQERRFADADEEQRNTDHQRANQKRDDGGKHQIDRIRRQRRRQHADEMHGPDADRQERRGAGQQHTTAHARRPADTRREPEASVTSQNRDHHRERDEIGIVSCEHDRLGRPSSRACLLPPPSL